MTKHLLLPRREVLMMGGAGVLGTFIAAATRNVAGAQTPSMKNIKSNLKTIRMGEFNPNYATALGYRMAQALGYFKEHRHRRHQGHHVRPVRCGPARRQLGHISYGYRRDHGRGRAQR